MKHKYTLASVIVNYKTDDRTVEFVKSELSKCTIPQVVVIVNNAAADGSTQHFVDALKAVRIDDIDAELPSVSSGVYVIHNPSNSGYARGNNMGARFVSRHFDVDYLLISNNDIRLLSDNVIECLIEKMEALPDVAIIGPKVLGLDGRCQSPYVYFPFWKEMLWLPYNRFLPLVRINGYEHDAASEGYFHHVMGSFFIVKFADFIDCGMMDEYTFLFYEEAILSERLQVIHKKEYYYPDVAVLHDHGFSMTKVSKQILKRDLFMESGFHYYRMYRGVSSLEIVVCKCIRCTLNLFINLYRYFK